MTTDRSEARRLRRRAEERLEQAAPPLVGPVEPLRLIHELEVHQIELEMQNEELRAARQETEAGLQRYTALFDFAPVGYIHLGPDAVIHELNFAGARLLGLERQRARGRRLDQHVADRHRPGFTRFLERVLAGEEENEPCEVTLDGQSGRREVRISAAPLGEPAASLLLALEDVTDRKRAEEALREEARNKDLFLAVLSHELRNPLAPIRNSLYVLSRPEAGAELVHRAHEVIDRQVAHLTHLVEDLLDVTRIARGKVRLNVETVELGEIVRRTVEDHRALLEAGGVEIETRFGPDLYWVDADPTRLAQVLGNLLSNAAKFTHRGGRVVVQLERAEAQVRLRVRDTGVGIAPEIMGSLFEPFVQAPQPLDRSHGGLGLGLAMVKGLLQLHGGTVGVRSDGPGRGAEFIVQLPLVSAPALASAPAPVARARPLRVLVIEDHLDAAESLRDALSLDGHTVEVATDGRFGLERARQFGPDVVICDIGMPIMDGYAVARAFRADPALRGTYLVALSGYALLEDRQRSAEAGFDRHVAKPPSLSELQDLMAAVPVGTPGRVPPPPVGARYRFVSAGRGIRKPGA